MLKRVPKLALAAAIVTVLLVPVAAVGSHDFIDVPDDHIFHDQISWLADMEVTKGCNPPANDQFCPEANVTRGQMAVFMNRLSEGRVVQAATAVTSENALWSLTAADADELDGNTVDDLKTLTFAAMEVEQGVGVFTSPSAIMMTLDFEVPVDGSILVTHATTFEIGPGPTAIALAPSLEGCEDFPWLMASYGGVSADHSFDSVSGVVPLAVTAGAHTLSYCGAVESSDIRLINTQLGVVYEPGGVAPAIEPPVIMDTGDGFGE